MPLTDTFVRQVKPSKPSGDKHADGGGMYLLVKPTGSQEGEYLSFLSTPYQTKTGIESVEGTSY
ncbi:MAG: integrase [Massilia sp.]|nr:integrase [Massilia sp.]